MPEMPMEYLHFINDMVAKSVLEPIISIVVWPIGLLVIRSLTDCGFYA